VPNPLPSLRACRSTRTGAVAGPRRVAAPRWWRPGRGGLSGRASDRPLTLKSVNELLDARALFGPEMAALGTSRPTRGRPLDCDSW